MSPWPAPSTVVLKERAVLFAYYESVPSSLQPISLFWIGDVAQQICGQCSRIQKIGRECKPNGENLYILPKAQLHLHEFCYFQITGQVTKVYLLREYMRNNKKAGITLFSFWMFTKSVHPYSRWFQMASYQDLYQSNACHFLFKDQDFYFSYILHP